MLRQKAKKTVSLPPSLCKTDVISVGSSEEADGIRKRSRTWHGIEDIDISQVDTVLAVGRIERKTGCDHQDKWETRIKIVAEEVLSERLRNVEYDHNDCKQICTNLSEIVHDRLKVVTDCQFKIIVLSFVGELLGGGIESATQCTWEPQKDVMVTAYFKNESLFAFANIFLTRVPETLV